MVFELGKEYGGYEFIDILEMSKTTVLYKVRNVVALRFEMLKILPKILQDDRERVERFLREIKVHARILHPNILTFYNAAEIEGQLVMTTELVEGVTLSHRLELGPLPWREAAGYIHQLLAALGYAHKQGVVHREITPDNVLVTVDGVAKLASFTLAKVATDQQLTVMGTALGVVEYMAPEQVKATSPLDARADLYSVGAVLYKLVTGKAPFEAASQFEMMLAQVEKEPTPPSSVNKDIPPELDQIILKALAKDPSARYQDADEFCTALEALYPALVGTRKEAPAMAEQPIPASPGVQVEAAAIPVAAPPPLPQKSVSRWGYPQLILIGLSVFLLMTLVFMTLFARMVRF
jgi:serine/threonine protein kinase